ncbi:hypothetical protein A2W24_06385 [Microgenomates group bacterium RBG_16_45_19]|nr:MAG: hypothetical protein A2W24_06385 [Microgenomates group bacterium RBG_16_45_19]
MGFDAINLPESWHMVRIGDVGDVITGRTPRTKRPEFYGGDYNLISPADLDNGKYVITAHKKLTLIGFDECRALPKDTVLVGCIGNVGKLGMIFDERSATNQQINAIICNKNNDPHFIYYCFHNNRSRLEQAADKTTLPILNKTNFENFEIDVPPLVEQRKIAGLLGVVQRAIEQQEQLLQQTMELKKTLLHQLFTQGLRGEPQKETEIGHVPESWEVMPLGNYLTEAQYGLSIKGTESGRYALLRMTNQQQGYISGDNLQFVALTQAQFERFRVERQDILFNRTNSLELVGRTAIFDIEEDFVFASYLIRLRTDAARLRPYFLNHYFNSDETQVRLKLIATRAVSQSNISATRLRSFVIPLPSPQEQDEIVAKIDCLDKKLSMHARKKLLLEELFRTLLHQLMTAQIRVNELDLAPM